MGLRAATLVDSHMRRLFKFMGGTEDEENRLHFSTFLDSLLRVPQSVSRRWVESVRLVPVPLVPVPLVPMPLVPVPLVPVPLVPVPLVPVLCVQILNEVAAESLIVTGCRAAITMCTAQCRSACGKVSFSCLFPTIDVCQMGEVK